MIKYSGYFTLPLRLIAEDLRHQSVPKENSTHFPAFFSTTYLNIYVPSREAVCTIFMMAFDMTQPGHKPTTYNMGQAR